MKPITLFFKLFLVVVLTFLIGHITIKWPTWAFLGSIDAMISNNAPWWGYIIVYLILEGVLLTIGWLITLVSTIYRLIYVNHLSFVLFLGSIIVFGLFEIYKVWWYIGCGSIVDIVKCVGASYIFLRLTFLFTMSGFSIMAGKHYDNKDKDENEEDDEIMSATRSNAMNALLDFGIVEIAYSGNRVSYIQLGNQCKDNGRGYLVEIYETKDLDSTPKIQYMSEIQLELFLDDHSAKII